MNTRFLDNWNGWNERGELNAMCVKKHKKASERMSWFVVYIKSRNEKIDWAATAVTAPLIPSYVFAQLEEKDRDSAFQATGVVRYLFWLGSPLLLEILRLKYW